MTGSQLVTRFLYPVLGPRRVMVSGLVVIASMMAVLSLVNTGTNLWLVRAVVYLLGVGMSGVFLPSQATAFATIPRAKTGDASTIFNTQRQLGGAVGVAILTTVITALRPMHVVAGRTVANLHAYHVGFLVAAGVALLAALAATTVHDGDASSTMVLRHRRTDDNRRPKRVLWVEGAWTAPRPARFGKRRPPAAHTGRAVGGHRSKK